MNRLLYAIVWPFVVLNWALEAAAGKVGEAMADGFSRRAAELDGHVHVENPRCGRCCRTWDEHTNMGACPVGDGGSFQSTRQESM